mgnify:CR=1 FL=1
MGALAALAPDVDAVSWLIGRAEAFREHHQFYTHNLIVFTVAPPLLGLGIRRLLLKTAGRARVVGLVWGAWSLHLLGDTLASWPVRLFWPFSRGGIAFDLLDRDFSMGIPLVLLAGTGASFARELAPLRAGVAVATLLAAAIYAVAGPGW